MTDAPIDGLLAKLVAHVPAGIAADDEAAARWLGIPTERYTMIKDRLWQDYIEHHRRERRRRLRPPPAEPEPEPASDSYVNLNDARGRLTYPGPLNAALGPPHGAANRLPSRAEIQATATEVA